MMKRLLMTGVRHPWVVLVLVLAVTVGMARVTMNGARIETNLDEYMPSDHPAFIYSDDAEELFGINDGILIAVSREEGIFNPDTLEKIRTMTEALSDDFDEIEAGDITSLYTAENIIADEWGMEVRPFYRRAPRTIEGAEEIRDAVHGNEMIYGRIVSADDTATLIIAEIPDDRKSDDLYARLSEWVVQYRNPEHVYVAGRPVVEGELALLGPADMQRMAPLVILVTAFLLVLLLRSFKDMIVNLLVVSAATIWAFGLMTLLGVPVYSVSTMIPVMLIAIGTAFGIHLHNAAHLFVSANPGATRLQIAEHALTTMMRPVTMAALTTAIGFLSLLTSQVLPVRYFGVFTAAGVLFEMVLALIMVPGSIVALGIGRRSAGAKDAASGGETVAGAARDAVASVPRSLRIARFLRRHTRATLMAAALVVVLGGWGMTRVWIDTSFLANFDPRSDIVVTDTFVNDHFGGTSNLNIVFEAEKPGTFKDPEVLRLIDSVQGELETLPVVGESFGLTDYLKRMHKVMHEDSQEYYRIPESPELVAQYLLLYEMSGDPENLNRVVDYDYQRANLTVQLKSDSSAVMEGVISVIEPYRDAFAGEGVTLNYAGSGYKSLIFAQLLLTGQMWSLILAFGIVAILLAIVFRSVLIGIIGTVPIAITAVVNFGVMGLLGIPLSSATAIISSIAIGIGVDYAIHLIDRFREYQAEGSEGNTERDTEAALDGIAGKTLAHTGRAILFNALAVTGGFAVLAYSVFPPNRQVGGLIALNMVTSAIGTLTVLVVLLLWMNRRTPVTKSDSTTEVAQ